MTDSAIADSVSRVGSVITPSAARPRQLEALARGLGAEDGGARDPRVDETQQAFVLRVKIEKKVVAELERCPRLRALPFKAQYCVSAIAVQIDQVLGGAQWTRR